jgi:hypothetical protein
VQILHLTLHVSNKGWRGQTRIREELRKRQEQCLREMKMGTQFLVRHAMQQKGAENPDTCKN